MKVLLLKLCLSKQGEIKKKKKEGGANSKKIHITYLDVILEITTD